MDFFEQELKKIIKNKPFLTEPKFIGGICYGKLSENTRIRIEFVKQGNASRYEGIKATLINKNDGPIDNLTLLFRDMFGNKQVNNPNFREGIVPYIWKDGLDIDWYVYRPNGADYRKISDSIDDYMDMFSEQRMYEPNQNQSFGSM